MSEEGGVWRTIGGRRVFIKDGQDLANAMKESGKFGTSKEDNNYNYLPEDENEAIDKYNEMSDKSYDALNEEERKILKNSYIGSRESFTINEALRTENYDNINKENFDKVIKTMDKACKSYSAEENMSSKRFVSQDFLKNVYNTEGDDRYSNFEQMKNQIGSVIKSPAYTSVSLKEEGSYCFRNLAVEMQINIPKGTKMYVPENSFEAEAILGRNTEMKLKDVNFKKSDVAGFEEKYGKILLTYEVVKNEE